MSRFLKKRVPAFLMTLVMVTTLIPMASAKSSADIEYEVDAGDNVTLEFSDFQNYYDKYESDNLYRMEFTDLTDVDSNGRMYAVDFEGDEVRVNEDDLYNSWFYASKSDVEDSGEYRIKGMNYSAGSKADGETAELAFTLYGDKKGELEGILRIYIGSSGFSKSGTISYSVKSGEEVAFDEDDFQKLYDKSSCTGTFKYLVFDRPSTSEYANGTIYSRYGRRNETSFSRSALNGNTFGYSDYADDDYDLSDLSFVADKAFTSGSITLSFTLYGGTGSRTNQSTTGTLVITSGNSGSSRSYYVGNIRCSVTPGTALQINPNDIARYFKKCSGGGNLMYVTLTSLPTVGSLYYNYYGTSQYGASSRTQMTAASAAGRMFAYSPSAKTEYALSELTYIPSGTNYCTAIGFTAYGGNGQSYTGSILISVSTQAVSEIYSVTTKGTSVSFPATAISSAVSGATGASLSSIQLLDLPATTSGVVYYGSSMANTTSQYAYANLSQLRFVPNSNFTGSVSIPYVALNSNGVAMAIGQFSIGVVSSVKAGVASTL